MPIFTAYYRYSSQWYDQGDDNYVPETHDGNFLVEALDLREAERKAAGKITKMNEAQLAGQSEEEKTINRNYPTHSLLSVEIKPSSFLNE